MRGLSRTRPIALMRRGGRGGFRAGVDYVSIFRAAAATNGLWLRGDVPSRISSTGGLVDSWTSDEGNARAFTSTLTARPGLRTVAGKSVPDFDGTNDVLTGPLWSTIFGSLGPITIEVVWLADSLRAATVFNANGLVATATSNRICMTAGSAAAYANIFCAPGNDRTAIPGVTNGAGSAIVPATGTVYRLRMTFDNSASITAKLGATSGNYNGSTGAHFTGNYGFAMLVGNTANNAYHDGAICEVFAIPSVMSAALAAQRDAWVSSVWGAAI